MMLLYAKGKREIMETKLEDYVFSGQEELGELITHLGPGPIVSDCLLYLVLNLVRILMRKRD